MIVRSVVAVLILCLFLAACGQESNQDIQQFVDENKLRPPNKLPSSAVYPPYKPFKYNAIQFRSPFDPPVLVEQKVMESKTNVKPDMSRKKQYLESFDFNSLAMVGTIEKNAVLWALIRDPSGSVVSVKEGAYLGKNHGKIVSLKRNHIDVVEIVPNGSDSWFERPNAINMREANEK